MITPGTESPTVAAQLVLVRALFGRACGEFEGADDLSLMSAVLLADLSVETLTKAACHERGIRLNQNHSLMDLVSSLKAKVPGIPDSLAASVRFIREQRNAVQHSGLVLSPASASRLVEEAIAWLRCVTREVFGRDFDAISAANLIRDPRLRQMIDDAESSAEAGDLQLAIATACGAFELVRCRWERSVGYADGFDDKRIGLMPRLISHLLMVMVDRYDDWEYQVEVPHLADDRYRALSRLTLGFTLDEFQRLRDLVGRCESALRDGVPIVARRDEVDFAIRTVARQIWRIESVHPDAVTWPRPPRPYSRSDAEADEGS